MFAALLIDARRVTRCARCCFLPQACRRYAILLFDAATLLLACLLLMSLVAALRSP